MKLSSAGPLRRRGAGLVDDVLHVVRREELALLDVHRLARLGHGADEVGLAAQEGRRLQHVDHGPRRHFGLGVHVGQHRHASSFFTLARISRPFPCPGRESWCRGAVGLVEAALEDEGMPSGGDLLELPGHVHLQLLGLDHAGAGDQEEGLVQADVEAAEFHAVLQALAAFWCASAALMKALNSGWPSQGWT
jgi:hypothetical protein